VGGGGWGGGCGWGGVGGGGGGGGGDDSGPPGGRAPPPFGGGPHKGGLPFEINLGPKGGTPQPWLFKLGFRKSLVPRPAPGGKDKNTQVTFFCGGPRGPQGHCEPTQPKKKQLCLPPPPGRAGGPWQPFCLFGPRGKGQGGGAPGKKKKQKTICGRGGRDSLGGKALGGEGGGHGPRGAGGFTNGGETGGGPAHRGGGAPLWPGTGGGKREGGPKTPPGPNRGNRGEKRGGRPPTNGAGNPGGDLVPWLN